MKSNYTYVYSTSLSKEIIEAKKICHFFESINFHRMCRYQILLLRALEYHFVEKLHYRFREDDEDIGNVIIEIFFIRAGKN